VGVVIPTHDRPGPLRTALDAVLAQDYPGQLRVIVVYDRAEPVLKPNDSMAVLVNDRTPGLAGARNTGIVKLDTDLVAFCDDDVWQPGKLRKQVWALQARPGAEFASYALGGDAAALAVFRAIARQPYFNPAGGS
jgi:glycosyltransferase involved in cell wall biosynthesis